jgi:hypothetical protein
MVDPKDLPHVPPEKLEISPAQQRIQEWQHAMQQIELARRYPTRQTPVEKPPPRRIQIAKR